MKMPEDPVILLSFVNTQLRDKGIKPGELAKEYGVEYAKLEAKLKGIGYCYDPAVNQYK